MSFDIQRLATPVGKFATPSQTLSENEVFDLDCDDEGLYYDDEWTPPGGIIEDLTNFYWAAAPSPFIEAAIAGAIGFLAGFVGRRYNVNGMGLNHYNIVVAPTATGKNLVATGTGKLYTALRKQVSLAIPLEQGVGDIYSPQGLRNSVSEHLCCTSILGEIGDLLVRITDNKASSNDRGIMSYMLKLFTASGKGNELGKTVYSDKEKNVKALISPAWSFVGDSTSHSLMRAITAQTVKTGFMSRMTFFEYASPRLPAKNKTSHLVEPDPLLINTLDGIVKNVFEMERLDQWKDVPLDSAAQQEDYDLDKYLTETIESFDLNTEDHFRGIWSRVREKTLRTAALLAVGVNSDEPVISTANYKWASKLHLRCAYMLIDRFKSGDTGEGNGVVKQQLAMKSFLKSYVKASVDRNLTKTMMAASITEFMLAGGFITYRYVSAMLRNRPCIAESSNPTLTLRNLIDDFVKQGYLRKVHLSDDVRGTYHGELWQVDSTVVRRLGN